MDKVSPYIVQAGNACEQGWQLLLPYKPKEWGPTLFGLLLVFFGGTIVHVDGPAAPSSPGGDSAAS